MFANRLGYKYDAVTFGAPLLLLLDFSPLDLFRIYSIDFLTEIYGTKNMSL